MLLPTFLPLCISLDKVWNHTAYKTHSSTSQKTRWMGRPFSNCKKVTLRSKCLDLAQGKSFCRDSNNAFITPCLCHVYCRTPCMMDSLLYNALHNNSCYLLGIFHHFKYLKKFLYSLSMVVAVCPLKRKKVKAAQPWLVNSSCWCLKFKLFDIGC